MIDQIDPPDGKERLVDGVTDTHIAEAVFRCTFYAKHKVAGEVRHVEVVRLAIPVSELPDIIQVFVVALTEAARAVVKPILS